MTRPPLERQPPDLAASAPLSLEERARRRRIEQRTAAARTAILLGRFDEARAALDELVELEPSLPAISEIAADLHTARARGKRKRPTLLAAVAAALVGVIAGALAGGATQLHRLVRRADSVPVAPLAGNAMPMVSVSPPVLTPTLSAELVEPAATAAVAPEPLVAVRADPVPPPPAAPPPGRVSRHRPRLPKVSLRSSQTLTLPRHQRPWSNARPRRLLLSNEFPNHRRRPALASSGLRKQRRPSRQTTRR